MSYTYNLQPSVPADKGESPSLGASRIRDLKNFLQERFLSKFYGFDTAGTETADGVKELPFVSQGSAPSTPGLADSALPVRIRG